ncbi:M23 family metallopeptidase [Ideonella sp. YS5]|uniref:M23 family metallopeptidase n=1 Tax=Ideonella sp. YS5 TaxID=3453714 RepID=UPI003EEA7EC9
MLISPPFLPARLATETEDAWIDRCMAGGQPGDGAFPLSFNLGWHGGMHLIAPMCGNQPEPVRAIADGTVVFLRKPTRQPSGPLPVEHPLAYRGGWTDDGVVVLRHETEIGEGLNGQVVFLSIYMHLSAIHPALAVDRTAYRKSEVGTAGQIYGDTQRRIHFEIVCNDANLRALVGRSAGELQTDTDGRLDAVYGQMYFVLPGGTPFYDRKPLDHLVVAHTQPSRPNARAPLPPLEALQAVYTSPADDTLVVGLRHAGGEGAEGHRGSAYLTTLRLDGTSLGEALDEADAEYNLYTRANEISEAYPADARPAPSAVYELLRFGRVVNTANETLTPSDVPHWRQVRYPGGQGWVNLNAPNVRKFSDADFPHWQRWQLIDDSEDRDSRCDSPMLRAWLDVSGDGQIDPIEATTRLSDPALAPRLARTICKFPTEWDAATIDQRWGWLKTSSEENPKPFSDRDFELLRAHIRALAFFPGNTGLPASHWHLQPREFVRQLRKCRWLDDVQLLRLMPASTAANRQLYRLHLNRCMEKYFVTGSVHRMTHFIGQGAHESSQLSGMIERGNTSASATSEMDSWFDSNNENYFNQYKGRNGNIDDRDHIKFRGRGLKQLTGRYNYGYYWAYRNWIASASFKEPWWNPSRPDRAPVVDNPQFAGSNAYTTVDAGGWYWEATPIRGLAGGKGRQGSSVNVVVDASAYGNDLIRRITRTINGGEIGLADRTQKTMHCQEILMDSME